MGNAINAFIHFIERRFSGHTVTLYRYVLRKFSNYAPDSPADLKMEHIERYLDSLSNLTNRSINAHLACLKSFGNYLADYHDLPNPTAKIHKLPEAPPKQRILTEAEYHKLMRSCSGTIDGDVIQFLANTGLRVAEFRSLTPGNFSSDGKFVTIVGKGRKQRSVPLNKTAQAIVIKHKPNMELLKSFKKSRNSVYHLCMRASKKAGIPSANPHSFRHYFATQLLKRGVPIAHVSKLLGHGSIRMTEIYIHFTSASLYGVTDVLDD